MTGQNQQNSLLGKIAAYTEILSKDPKSTIFVSLSEAYRKMGMLDDARKVVEKGLEEHGDFSPAYIVLGRILCQQGNYSHSADAFKNALKHDPENLAALVGYARLHILLGEEEKAKPLLLTARTLSPADPVINKLLLSLPETTKDDETSQTEINVEPVEQPVPVQDEQLASDHDEQPAPVLEEQPAPVLEEQQESDDSTPPLVSATLAELYLKQGLSRQALEVYKQLSAEDPDNFLYRRNIRDLEDSMGRGGEEEAAESTTDEQITAVVEEAEDSAAKIETDIEEADLPPETVIAPSAENPDERIVASLNSWLESIKRRRDNV